ncbi:4-alpha-glucanotransferase [Thermodesulfovibrio aggregans]|uniref:4-alpha-glucanotransferase n=1 Tax=Thermodesulfovibrio aggregans TaxID=86166 RepID=UPI0013793EA1|nr:4-alpha-glucanotransferase [Thermodesulfovibrio aggregans]
MKHQKQLICEFSDLVGIIPFYYDCKGNYIEISLETKAQILYSMGFNPEQASDWIDYFKNYSRFLEPVYVIEPEEPVELKGSEEVFVEIYPLEELAQSSSEYLHPSVDSTARHPLGDSTALTGDSKFKVQGSNASRRFKVQGSRFKIPSLPIGYYRMIASTKDSTYETVLIVVPKHCFIPDKNKTWGIHCNLWSFKENSEGNFSQLKKLAEYLSNEGGFLSINPLHFNDPEDIYGISPYSALSREFKTPLYLSKCSVKVKNEEFFEYSSVWKEKMQCLKKDFEAFYKKYINGDAEEFIAYKNKLCPAIREDLKYFAVFCFLREKFGKDWQNWNPQLRCADTQILNKIYRDNEKEVLFYEYLQWLVDSELEEIRKYPILVDMGFCSIKSSFDVWLNQELFALRAEYGAPPDDFNPKGQKWGAPPLIPFKLKEKAYLPFIKILRANMKTKLLRIDHALGLFRAYWIPEGSTPQNGAYVRYPWKDLLGIIALESQLNRTGIIGEDLGTAEDWMKEELIKRKICSWRVFYFEKTQEKYKPSTAYPEYSLCSITTHDLPTFKGFWHGKDIELREKFKIYDEQQAQNALIERQKDKEKIIALLKEEGLFQGESIEELLFSIIKFLSKTPSRYLLLYLEDILLMEDQTNFPGTTTEYPNWQRKLPKAFKEIIELPNFRKIQATLKESDRTVLSD